MPYLLYFWSREAGPDAAAPQLYLELAAGRVDGAPVCPAIPEFRRDLISSDPDWIDVHFTPRGGPDSERYLALELPEPPDRDRLRDLRYVAARNGLLMYDPQRAAVGAE